MSLVQWMSSSKKKYDDQSSNTLLFLSPATACSAAAANDAVLVKMSKAQGSRKHGKYHTYSDKLHARTGQLLSTTEINLL